jgi:hypothetical protein
MRKKLTIFLLIIFWFCFVKLTIASSNGTLSEGNSGIVLSANIDMFTIGFLSGSTYTLTITVTGGPSGNKGGFNLKASAGILTNPGANTQIVSGEATHTNPNSRSWMVDWIAPDASISSATFFYAGNAVNGNGSNAGDDPTPTATKTAQKAATAIELNELIRAQSIQLFQNYPNPFNGETNINYQINQPGLVDLKIFDINGKQVFENLENHANAGVFSFTWNGRTNEGIEPGTGIYICQLKFNNISMSKKLIYVK